MSRVVSKRWLVGAAIAVAVSGVLWVYLQASEATQMADPDKARKLGQPIPVRTAYVTETEIDALIGATAVTVPSEVASIRIGPSRGLSSASPVSDIVVRALHAQEGSPVATGTLLMEMEDEVIREVLKQKESAFA